jgi:hypothetical protein
MSQYSHQIAKILEFDINDPISIYDEEAVFDVKKQGTPGVTLKTLADWKIYRLELYVEDSKPRNGEPELQFATFGERVKKLLHSVEILIKRQVKLASQDYTTYMEYIIIADA